MANGTIDDLRIGHILHYVYLFEEDAAKGLDEGLKTRPVVVLHVDRPLGRVHVLAVTTKGERYPDTVPLPPEVSSAAKLSPESSVVVSEYNHFRWLGFDIRPVADGYIAGRLPPGFTAKIRSLAATAVPIDRD